MNKIELVCKSCGMVQHSDIGLSLVDDIPNEPCTVCNCKRFTIDIVIK